MRHYLIITIFFLSEPDFVYHHNDHQQLALYLDGAVITCLCKGPVSLLVSMIQL